MSPTLFHWESQSTTTPESRTGRRYLEHRASGGHVWLFARQNRADARGMTAPYLFLGPAHYVKHTGSRPISFTWRLEQPMPQPFFEQGKVVGG